MPLHAQYSFRLLFIHSAVCLTRSHELFPKRILHWVQSGASASSILTFPYRHIVAAYIFFLVFFITPILSSAFLSIMSFKRQFLRKMWPTQITFLLFIVCRTFLPSLTQRNTLSFLTRSVQLIFSSLASITFQKFPGICDLLAEVTKFQHHRILCCKCSTNYFLS